MEKKIFKHDIIDKQKKDPRGMPDQDMQYDVALVRITGTRNTIWHPCMVEALDMHLRRKIPGYYNERVHNVALDTSHTVIILICDVWNIETTLTLTRDFLRADKTIKQGATWSYDIRDVKMNVMREKLHGEKKFFTKLKREGNKARKAALEKLSAPVLEAK